MTRFSDEEWIEALKKAVADKGEEFVYRRLPNTFGATGAAPCLYAEEIQDEDGVHLIPACLVGHAAYLLGGEETLAELHAVEGLGAQAALYKLDLASLEARELLDTVQGRQDCGQPWGEAIKDLPDQT